jgi:hypothetical protein
MEESGHGLIQGTTLACLEQLRKTTEDPSQDMLPRFETGTSHI